MSGLAEILRTLEFDVSGSDRKASDTTRRLEGLGAKFFEGHDAHNVDGADVIVYSSAIQSSNPELERARQLSIPAIQRAEMLAELMRLKYAALIAGSHGKTTTTSLVATILREAGLDPTVVVGGKVNALGSNARLGAGDLFVAEADESDGSFLRLTPTIAVVTNIDPEHLDHYGTLEKVMDAFVDFVNKVPFYGLGVLCVDHPNVQAILPRITRRYVTYGLSRQADYRARNIRHEGLVTRFEAVHGGNVIGEFSVRMPGVHNVLNALAALVLADELAVPMNVVREAIGHFHGVQRRFTVVAQPSLTRDGEAGDAILVDDYGHHPAEVEATLAAAQSGFDRRIIVAFQPHRYTRTRDLFDEFTRAFNKADVVFMTEVYAAGEAPIAGATGEALAKAVRAHGHHACEYVADKRDLAARIHAIVRPNDLVISLGAGDVNQSVKSLALLLAAEAKS